ncbi:MAG: Response regulator [Myxococcaceae bacterium]|jgi:two-component system response regulator CpxR|nr:Response regulator [Myxococcaceae bacterium]
MNSASERFPYVLVVEDDLEIAATLREILTEEGYTVAWVCDGDEAFSWIAANGPPSLMLLDLMLPRVTGEEFLERRKTMPNLDKIPVIVFTAGPMEAKQAIALGAVGFFRKPLDYDAFVAMVKRYFEPRPPASIEQTLDWKST